MNKEGQAMKFLLLIILILFIITVAFASAIVEDIKITSLPHNSSENITINIDGNNTEPIIIVCNSTAASCQYVTPSITNFTNSSNITFSTYIPSNTPNQNVTETFNFYINNTKIENLSVIYNLEIIVPPIRTANITITEVSPGNNSFFGQYDNLPDKWRISYTGDLDLLNSNFRIYINNTLFTDYNFWNETNSLIWNFTSINDGNYVMEARFQDSEGYNLTKSYQFQIKTTPPPRPLGISPGKFQYTNEIKDLQITMDHSNYTVYYIINDGYPSIANSGWQRLSYINEKFSKIGFDFSNEGIGQIYLKIIDQFDNIRIEPTCIISAPSIDIQIEDRTKSVEPGDEIRLDIEIDIKKGSGEYLRCKMSDFIANEDLDDETYWSVKNIATLHVVDDEDNDMFLEDDYDMTIDLGSDTSAELELRIKIPINAKINEDFRSDLECIIN
jgi:hypothetical protein